MVVQLAALGVFSRLAAGHYLLATAAAIEIAVLHNFVWHLHFTWRDRRDKSAVLAQLMRFHLSNGLVSMVGNLVLMRILVHEASLPLLVANGIAILCCSVVNFCLGDGWAFAVRAQAGPDGVRVAGIPPPPEMCQSLRTRDLRFGLPDGPVRTGR
jgi:putative flippase GtrA